jgi:hypothetical protein
MFAPSNYTADRAWPVLYCLDPGARGRVPVERFAAAAEKAGFLVAGSNNSRNGPMGPVQEAIGLMLADTHERFSIDDSRVYAAGLSGGARVALQWAQNGHIAGVACSAGFGAPGPPKQFPSASSPPPVGTTSTTMTYHLSRELARRSAARFVEFEGGHEWMPAALADGAFGFFRGHARPRRGVPGGGEAGCPYERLMAQMESAAGTKRRSIIRQLKDALPASGIRRSADCPASDRRSVHRRHGIHP